MFVLDDSFEHEIFTPPAPKIKASKSKARSSEPQKLSIEDLRVVLIVDLWHPDVTRKEMAMEFAAQPMHWDVRN